MQEFEVHREVPIRGSIVRTLDASDVVYSHCKWHCLSAEGLAFQAMQHGGVISLHAIYSDWTCCARANHQQIAGSNK